MTATRRHPSAQTRALIEARAAAMTTGALRRVEASLPWWRTLSADDRSWIGLVAQAGIAAFVSWLRDDTGQQQVTANVFGTAPRELTSSISLQQTLDLIRAVVDAVEDELGALGGRTDGPALREAVLRYSREIAFSAAQVYARAAESRGAWDARLEDLVVDAVLRGEADDSMRSRATALGWGSIGDVTVVAGRTPSGRAASTVEAIRRDARSHGGEALAAVQRSRLVVILGRIDAPLPVVRALAADFGDGPIVVGPTVPHLFAAGRSARAALSGLAAAVAWSQAPRPVHADDLLPERVLVGDERARRLLVDRIDTPLREHPTLAETARVFLETGVLETTARVLFVHPNTVRYRLGRIVDLTGYDLTAPRDGYAVRMALGLGRLARPEPVRWREPTDGAGGGLPVSGAEAQALEDSSKA